MITFKIAGCSFGLTNRMPETATLLADYLTHEAPDIVLDPITDDEIESFNENCRPFEREFFALHGRVVKHLLAKDILLFHGSSLAYDGKGILFTAPSGTGKSTHARLWCERFGDDVVMINDDKPLLQYDKESGSWRIWGTPWCGKERIQNNINVPLKSLVVIKRGETNSIRLLAENDALDNLLSQSFIPATELPLRLKALDLLDKLVKVPVYELSCTISQEAVSLSLQTLKN